MFGMVVLVLAGSAAWVVVRPAEPSPLPAPIPTSHTPAVVTPPVGGCGVKASVCGFPDASTTGVQVGVSLRSSGCVTADQPGQVVENLVITDCTVEVTAPNVTVRNVKIVTTSVDMWALRVSGAGSGTISNVEIAGRDKDQGSVQYAILNQTDDQVNVDHANLHHCADCIQGEAMTVTDSYIHDMANPAGAHVDGFQCNSSCGVTVRHNTILNEWSQTAAIALFGDFGTPANSVIDNNLLAGGGYSVYGGTPRSTNITVTNNRFSRLYFPNGGYWGVETALNRSGTGNRWSGNTWDDTGAPTP